MPAYIYVRESDHDVKEIVMSVAEKGEREQLDDDGRQYITIDGDRYYRDIISEHMHVAHSPGAWPLVSAGAGVAPQQIGNAIAAGRAQGVDMQFNSNGDAIFTSRKHRAECMKVIGLHDKDAGYGDRTPNINELRLEE